MIGLLFSRVGLAGLKYLALAGAVVGVLLAARNAGRQAERIEVMEIKERIRDAQLEAALGAPRNRADLVDRLSGWDI